MNICRDLSIRFFFVMLLASPVSSAECSCAEWLLDYGIEFKYAPLDKRGGENFELQIVFDSERVWVDDIFSSMFVKIKKKDSIYLKVPIFIDGHDKTRVVDGKYTYFVFANKEGLSNISLELKYFMRPTLKDNYLHVFIAGFEDIQNIECNKK
ncbi:hypothetical protein ACVBEJ_07065 [Porticoccus sp. GXU_MW_L64]